MHARFLLRMSKRDRVTPDLVRSTILSLVPQLRLPDERKRSLIVETQRSDFSQPSVVEYFIGIVGVAAYESALRTALGSAVSSLAVSSEPMERAQKHLVTKAYCHGGDVAFFGGVDLEFESSINNALFGHCAASRRSRVSPRPDLAISETVEKRLRLLLSFRGEDYGFSPAFVAAAHSALAAVMHELISHASQHKQHTSSSRGEPNLISVGSAEGSKKIELPHILSSVQEMQIPARVGNVWEQTVIKRLVEVGRPKFGFYPV